MHLSRFSIVGVHEVGITEARTEGAAVCASVLHLHDCIIFTFSMTLRELFHRD